MKDHVCPWWVGYLLLNPLRKIFQNQKKILSPYISQGMTVLDYGCAMGFFSLPLAKLVKKNGKVICIDLQQKMINILIKRATKAKMINKIKTRLSNNKNFGLYDLSNKIDFVLLFSVVHEVNDKKRLFSQIYNVMKKDSKILIAEPIGHVSNNDFKKSISIAENTGLQKINNPEIKHSHSVLLCKN